MGAPGRWCAATVDAVAATIIRRCAGAPWRRTHGRILALAGEEVHELTGGAATVWEQLGAPTELDEFCERLATMTDASADDIRTAVHLLIDAGVIEECE